MAGLLGELKKKPTINRGKKITTDIQIQKRDILDASLRDFEKNKDETQSINTDDMPTNIRVDQGMRNKINALGIIGYGDSQKEVIEYMLTVVMESLSDAEVKKVEDLAAIYKKKDLRHLQKNRSKKKQRPSSV